MHLSFESLAVFNVSSLHASLMNTYHDTSFRSILEDDFISLTSKVCIHSYSGKGTKLWLVARSSICSFWIAHSTFILVLRFHLGLIHLLTFSLLTCVTCESGHELDAFGIHLACCFFGGQWIVTHDAIWNIMYAFVFKSGHDVWKKWWYAFTSGVSLQVDFYMTREDQCCNPNLGLATKARVCKGAGQEWSLGVTFHAPGNVGKCEGLNFHTPKWAPTLGIGVPMDSRIFKKWLRGSKPIGLKSSLYHCKDLGT
jgi:hypothetical protein